MTCGKLVLLWIRKLVRFHSSVMCYCSSPTPHPLRTIRRDGLQPTPVGIQFLCLTFSKLVNVDTVDYKFPCVGNLPLRLCMSHQPPAISSCLHPRGLSPTWQSSSRNENRLIKPKHPALYVHVAS